MPRLPRQRLLHPARPALATALAALLALSQVAAVAHQLASGHRTCEHGELIESDAPALVSSENGEQDGAHLLAGAEERAAAEHVHCLALSQLRQAAASPPTHAPAEPRSSSAVAKPPALAAVSVPRERLLLLAPKSSPPA